MWRPGFMIAMAGGLATLAGARALAQRPAKPARVGYVWIGARGSTPDLDGLLQGFADLGYAAGRNPLLEERYADGHPERLPALLAELLALNVAVLLTPGFQTTLAAQRATSTVPIVSVSEDPVGAGLVASLTRPGGNITGLSLLPDAGSATWLELLKEASPTLNRVAVLWSPDSPVLVRGVERLRKAAPKLGLDVTAFSVRPQEIDASLAAIATARPDGLVVCDAPFFFSIRPRLIAFAAKHRLPTLYSGSAAYVRQGGLMSYSANFFGLWRHAAGYVDRILKGARLADLPLEQSQDFLFLINLKTATALGLVIPARAAGPRRRGDRMTRGRSAPVADNPAVSSAVGPGGVDREQRSNGLSDSGCVATARAARSGLAAELARHDCRPDAILTPWSEENLLTHWGRPVPP